MHAFKYDFDDASPKNEEVVRESIAMTRDTTERAHKNSGIEEELADFEHLDNSEFDTLYETNEVMHVTANDMVSNQSNQNAERSNIDQIFAEFEDAMELELTLFDEMNEKKKREKD